MRWRTLVAAVGVLGAMAVIGMAARAGSAPRRCRAAKLKAAGAEIAGKMGCYARAKKAGAAVDAGCLSGQSAKPDAAIEKAGDACPGTAAAIDAAVDSCVGAFLGDDPGNGACAAASAKAVGKAARIELGCEAKVAFAACETKADGRIPALLGKAGGCVDPAAVVGDIHACGGAIDALIGPPPTTTTTLLPPEVVCCAHPAAPACKYVTSAANCVAESGDPSPGTLCNPATGACSEPPIQPGSCCTLTLLLGGTLCSAGPFYDTASNCTAEEVGSRLANARCPPSIGGSCVR
jgi:hypothetical protein